METRDGDAKRVVDSKTRHVEQQAKDARFGGFVSVVERLHEMHHCAVRCMLA